MNKNKLFQSVAALLIAVGIFSLTACSKQTTSTASSSTKQTTSTASSSTKQTTVYGKVTAINGKKITIALGTLNQRGGNQKSITFSNDNASNESTVSNNNASNGNTSTDDDAPQGAPPSGNNAPPHEVNDADGVSTATIESSDNNAQQGTPPGGRIGRAPELLTLTGESKTFTILDTTTITKQNAKPGENSSNNSNENTASIDDITVGSILKVTYYSDSDEVISIEILGGDQPGGGQPAGDTAELIGTGLYTLNSGSTTKSNETLTASKNDQSADIAIVRF
ncbi:hypothetical protein Tmath_0945 [Thermoanaerobacter mathranii subsp. mathranii str. A3]|uniref:Lipoprotein n=1 Tax=Thermoanaerobacter mathranii subsp. mathranii (strain DSM 11426 / CCUG 53645 / CIP 108742 / A3) TaxID=583358 RepID=A0ABN3Z450_THEM3|nr:hypothetical protein [Thermoanaerobacter mathranii]ADH60680.1 hypothetical protein Tmath_0945 [Thermoanaerobacter mathranii subsp. mathranii str. A3]